MRTITNDYHDAQVLDLGSRVVRGPYLEDGPYLVTQTGVSPTDPLPKTRMFVLRPGRMLGRLQRLCLPGKAGSHGRACFSQHRRGDADIQ